MNNSLKIGLNTATITTLLKLLKIEPIEMLYDTNMYKSNIKKTKSYKQTYLNRPIKETIQDVPLLSIPSTPDEYYYQYEYKSITPIIYPNDLFDEMEEDKLNYNYSTNENITDSSDDFVNEIKDIPNCSGYWNEDDSGDDEYNIVFTCINKIQKICFNKENLLFVFVDQNDLVFGNTFPSLIKKKENLSLDCNFFIISKGIEMIEKKWSFGYDYNSINFPDDLLILYGDRDGNDKNWIYKIDKNMNLFWNDYQLSKNNLNKTVLMSKKKY